jgi:hypothetical protein
LQWNGMECPLAVPKLVGSVPQQWTTKRYTLMRSER